MGSGTVAVVAEEQGLRWKGTEISEKYCRLIASKMGDG
jgi:DNA modification methylase